MKVLKDENDVLEIRLETELIDIISVNEDDHPFLLPLMR